MYINSEDCTACMHARSQHVCMVGLAACMCKLCHSYAACMYKSCHSHAACMEGLAACMSQSCNMHDMVMQHARKIFSIACNMHAKFMNFHVICSYVPNMIVYHT